MEVGAVEGAAAFADVAEANSLYVDVRQFFFGDAYAVVFDFNVQPAVAIGGAQLDFAAFDFGCESVLEAIFDDGLEKHAGDESFERVFLELLDDLEVVAAEAGDFDVQIVIDEFQLFVQWDEGLVLAQQPPQNVAQLQDHAARGVRVKTNQRGNGVQRVEQEMGIDLTGESIHAGLQQQLLVALQGHLDARVVPNLQRRGHGHQCSDDGQS